MSKTFLIIGIIVTGLSALVITIVSLSRFILKRIYKEEEKMKTREEKQKDKYVKRILSASKKVLKFINKRLLKSYLAFYGISATIATAGTVAIVTSSVQIVKEQRAMEDSTSLVSEDISSEVMSSEITSSETVSNNEVSSDASSEISSEELSTNSTSEEISESSLEDSSSSIEQTTSVILNQYTVTFKFDDVAAPISSVLVNEGEVVADPGSPDLGTMKRVFKYWAESHSISVPYDFSTPITEDTTIYAITNTAYYVTYTINDVGNNFEYEYQELVEENTCAAPNPITRTDTQDQYTWYYSPSNDPAQELEVYDFDTPISSDLDLIGQ